ncbi:MAG: N-acetylmuramoyl-L-alanine amidase [Pseudomonadota bacterium]
MSSLRIFILCLAAMLGSLGPVRAEMTALARVDAGDSVILGTHAGVLVDLSLSQPVPWRVFTLDAPRRVVLDFSEVIWPDAIDVAAGRVDDVRMGVFQPGWSRMVIDLNVPMVVQTAELSTRADDGTARLNIFLAETSDKAFAAASGTPASAQFSLDTPAMDPVPAPAPGDGRLRVMLDPGHGGIDPGAEAGGLVEADVMLTFARELREVLLRAGGFDVVMTRDEDVFVPLETRISLARAAQADVFVSLHADALPDDAGEATGATIYTLSDSASDLASQRLAERHDQADLLAGIDLSGQGDEIALVLMDIARRETAPRTDMLARHLVEGLGAATGSLNNRPRRSAGFSVLKAPDIPSVLVEIGFLSSAEDREKLADPAWRLTAAQGIRDGLRAWAQADAARARLVRN